MVGFAKQGKPNYIRRAPVEQTLTILSTGGTVRSEERLSSVLNIRNYFGYLTMYGRRPM